MMDKICALFSLVRPRALSTEQDKAQAQEAVPKDLLEPPRSQRLRCALKLVQGLSPGEREIVSKKVRASPRPLSLAVIERPDGRLLVDTGHDPHQNQRFYRLLGGGIEFGETSQDALAREIREELGVLVQVGEHLGTIENIFSFNGKPGHEIAFLYRASFLDSNGYLKPQFVVSDVGRTPTVAVWKSLAEIDKEQLKLYPEGVRGFLGGR